MLPIPVAGGGLGCRRKIQGHEFICYSCCFLLGWPWWTKPSARMMPHVTSNMPYPNWLNLLRPPPSPQAASQPGWRHRTSLSAARAYAAW